MQSILTEAQAVIILFAAERFFQKTITNIQHAISMQKNDASVASYSIALLVAKSYIIGGTLLHPFIEDVLSTVMYEKPH